MEKVSGGDRLWRVGGSELLDSLSVMTDAQRTARGVQRRREAVRDGGVTGSEGGQHGGRCSGWQSPESIMGN